MADERETKILPTSSGLKNFTGLLPVAIAFVALAMMSWRKWPDILIDFGLQLYTPWQICSGKVLYRDLTYLAGGPFSQYFNALLFKIFGVSFTTLIVTNLAIVALMLLLIYRFFLKISDQITATLICFTIVSVFAFSHYLQVGNYNFIAPYTHETLHGLALSIVAILFLSHWFFRKRILSIGSAGICYGLVFLTKPETFLALTLPVAGAFVIHIYQNRTARGVWPSVICFIFSTAIPFTAAFMFFRRFVDNREALTFAAGAWAPVLFTPAAKNEFYRSGLGLDDLFPNLILTVSQFFGYCFCLVLCAWCSVRSSQSTPREKFLRGLIFIGLIVAAFNFKWFDAGRALLFFTPSVCAILFWFWRKDPEKNPLLVPALLWSVFSLTLLAKMGVHNRIWHYGFFLGMPATISAIYFVFGFLPRALASWNVDPKIFRTIIFILLAIGTFRLVSLSHRICAAKNFPVGRGGDLIFSFAKKDDPTGPAMEPALEWINANLPRNATLAVLPEGATLNYLSRRANPSPFTNLTLPVWQAFGEETILDSFKKTRPDYLVLIHRDASEYGLEFFGLTPEYGLKTMRWIKENYSAVHLIGQEPLQSGAFGIKILKRNPPEK